MWGKLQSKAFQMISHELNKEGIQWMVMRNYEGLPYENRSRKILI